MKTVMVEGDKIALDALVFAVTGREDMVPAVLEANLGLARLGAILPVGTQIRIPDPPIAQEASTEPLVTLWSE